MNERPEYGRGGPSAESWSETGDRYILKLFRDYVFHQTDGEGRPSVDVAHMVECLNKLDVGSPEKILLASNDGRSLLVVAYHDIRRCLEEAFQELTMSGAGMRAAPAVRPGGGRGMR